MSSWAQTHYPPLHYFCRTIVTTVSKEEAEGSISESGPDVSPLPGFGAAPAGIGGDWEPDPSEYPAAIGDVLDERLEASAG